MISTIEIYKAIRERLEETFPNVLVEQKDIKNIKRPSFYIQYVGKNFDKQAVEYYEDRISFNIIYFSAQEKLLELLEIEEAFTKAFNAPLMIPDDTYIVRVEKNAIQSNLNEEDYYINLTIDFNLMQRMSDEETGDTMENVGVAVSDGASYFDNEDETMSDVDITT